MENRMEISVRDFKIQYEFRFDCHLLIMTNFRSTKYAQFADSLEQQTEVQMVRELISYDDKSGAIIIQLKVGYDRAKVKEQINTVFTFFFSN